MLHHQAQCEENVYRLTGLSEAQRQGITDEELDDTMCGAARPWAEQWESLGTDGSKWEEQELNDDDRQARCWRRRPDGFAVKEEERIIYVLEFKRVSDAGEGSSGPMPSTSALQSQHFVLTGQPKYMMREKLRALIRGYGGKVFSTVSGKKWFLVSVEKDSKARDAGN